MGTSYSKAGSWDSEPSSPCDPRSPTSDISRTPILKLDESQIQKITKNVDLTKECFEKYANNMPINPAVKLIMNEFDPRSPTIDFQRTPLSVMIKNPELIAAYNRVNSEELNSSNISYVDVDNTNTSMAIEKCIKNLDKDLADLSVTEPVLKKVIDDEIIVETLMKNMKSCTNPIVEENNCITPVSGLLETNLDYIETDIDTVKRRYKSGSKKNVKLDTEQSKIQDLSDKDPRSPSICIDRTPIVVPKIESSTNKSTPQITQIDLNLHMKDIFSHNMVLQQKRNERRLTNYNTDSMLIYEDNIEEVTIKKIIQNNEGSRTPLSTVNNEHTNNSKTNTPNSKKSAKKSLSKIPVKVKPVTMCHLAALQNIHSPKKGRVANISKMNRLMDMSENTPPKPRQACWDQDNSVLL